MWKYWTLLTDLRGSEIARMQEEVHEGALHPMQAKKNLAWTITRDFHSKDEADAAAESWAKMFQRRETSDSARIVKIDSTKDVRIYKPSEVQRGAMDCYIKIPRLLQHAGLAVSTTEATRKIAENAVSINGTKFSGQMEALPRLGKNPVLRVGKKEVQIEWVDYPPEEFVWAGSSQ
jgi:tyrosyl-tRNA synthetase